MNCSEQTAREIDKEVHDIIEECYKNAKKMLEENIDILNEIAEYLFEKETITGKQFMEIYHKIKGDVESEEDKTDETGDSENVSNSEASSEAESKDDNNLV